MKYKTRRNNKKRAGMRSTQNQNIKKYIDNSITGDDSTGATLLKSSSGLVGDMAGIAIGIADKMIAPSLKSASDSLFQGYQNESFKDVAPNIASELKKNSLFIKNISKDPIIREALKEYGKSLGDVVETVAEVAKPVIDEAVNDVWEAIDEAGEKSVIGAANTGINLFKAAVAEVPVVGGLIDLGLAGAQAINYTAAAVKPLIVSGTKNLALASKAASNASGKISEVTERMETSKDNLTNALDKVKNVADSGTSALHSLQNNIDYVKNKPLEMNSIVNASKNIGKKKLKQTRKNIINNVKTGINNSVRNSINGGRRSITKRTEKRLKKSISRFTRNRK